MARKRSKKNQNSTKETSSGNNNNNNNNNVFSLVEGSMKGKNKEKTSEYPFGGHFIHNLPSNNVEESKKKKNNNNNNRQDGNISSRKNNKNKEETSASSTTNINDNNQNIRWTQKLFSLIFSREEFDDIPVTGEVTPEQIQTFRVVDRLMPSFAKRPAFYTVDFFTRRRVMFVLLIIAILIGYSNFHEDVLSLTASFYVADDDRPGIDFLKNNTIKRRHPIMIVPGFISTALEVWENKLDCLDAHRSISSDFRQRMFSSRLLLLLITDPVCYLQLFSLDKNTGFDPPGVRLRPDLGFGASDFFLPGYWVWAKVLLNLADIGYGPQNMGVFSYDWRLSPRRMHRRDGSYYDLRNHITYLYEKNNNERVVLISHSYGVQVLLDFFRWSESHEPGWMNKYISHWINIAGPALGVAKSVSAILTGEAKDTLTLPIPIRTLLETHLSRELRMQAVRTWSCMTAMYPLGCNEIFPDILQLANGTHLTPEAVLEFTIKRLHESGHVAQEKHARELLQQFHTLPVLPPASNVTIICLYGVDKVTESGYILSEDDGVNLEYHQFERASNGVYFDNGDGTVPLLSLGYMCRASNGWKQNVGKVITREHRHNIEKKDIMHLRGGSRSGDHVDILGNYELIETILKVVTGNAEKAGELTDRIYSDVDERIAKAKECNGKKNHIFSSRKENS